MDKKLKRKTYYILLFAILVVFPLGQIPRLLFNLAGFEFPLHPLDLFVLLNMFFLLLFDWKYLLKYKKIVFLLIVFFFTTLWGAFYWKSLDSLRPFMYYLRFAGFLSLFVSTRLLFDIKLIDKKALKNILYVDGLVVSLVGLFQYFLIPDLRTLYTLGWDDHLNRLASVFLDPAFTGIILIFTIILGVNLYLENRQAKYVLLTVLPFITLLLTYSRSSYIALLGAATIFIVSKNKRLFRHLLLGIGVFVCLLLFLPKGEGEGVNLLRTKSISLRMENYIESVNLIKNYPVWGIGFNYTCLYKAANFEVSQIGDNSCSGLDNSFLFIFATTGLIGIITYFDTILRLMKNIKSDLFLLIIPSAVALGIHSMFQNTLFYPYVMMWMAIILALNDEVTVRK